MGQSISVGTLGRSRNYIADVYVDRFAHVGELSRLKDRLHRSSAKTVPISLSIGLLILAGCGPATIDRGDTLAVVNEASADLQFTWAEGGSIVSDSPSQKVSACSFERRGFRRGQPYSVSIRTATDHRDFTVDVPSAGPVTFHTVVVLPTGKIQTSSEEWPVGGSPCPPASFKSS